jgi:gamma-polyglutamate synthase
MLTITILLCIILSLLVLEKWLTQRSVNSLKLRIHVNGTRGKSSLTEYIAAGISASQTGVMAKITGIVPTIIHNGKAQIISRSGVARVQEQVDVIRLAAKKKVRSLILECMSISPELQKLESSLFKPHIYVITNIRDDHREEMGRNTEEQVRSICNAIPENCTVITNELRFLNTIRETAATRNSEVICSHEVNADVKHNLPPGIFSENVSLALTACEAAGIDSKLAKEGILKHISILDSPLTIIHYKNNEIKFLNAFAANDIESTNSFIDHWKNKINQNDKMVVLLNTRADRPVRTDLFAEWISNISSSVGQIIITGNHFRRAKHQLIKAGIDKIMIHTWRGKLLENIKEELFNIVPGGTLVVGVGNIGGDGFYILNKLK